jgi:Phosphorylase superfamily
LRIFLQIFLDVANFQRFTAASRMAPRLERLRPRNRRLAPARHRDRLPQDHQLRCWRGIGAGSAPAVRPTDPLWSRKLAEMIPDARHGPIMGVNSVVSDPADKRKLHTFTRAVAVDMESHLVARLADAHGLAFAAVRVIIDPAHRAVPPAALLAMAPGGSTDVSAMLWEILARPSNLEGSAVVQASYENSV